MSTTWTNTTAFANVPASTVDTADILPYADMSQAAGSRQRTITVATLQAITNGLVSVVSYAGNRTIDLDDDLGAHVRITAVGTVTFPEGLTVGASGIVENATVSDTVTVAGGGSVTLLSAGTEIANGKWVAWVVVNANVVAIVGAFADEVTDTVSGPASAVDDHIATFDGTTGKLVQDGGYTISELAAIPVTINAQTGTTYTLVLTDAGKLVTLSNAAAITLTVPTNASVAFPVGTVIAGAQIGAGLVSIAGATGVTINGATPGAEASAGQWSAWSLTKLATDTWLASGGLA